MPALNGQVMITLPSDTGGPGVLITYFFDPVTRLLRQNPTDWTSPNGDMYPANTGALIAENYLGRTVKVRVNDLLGVIVRKVSIPTDGRSYTALQLAAALPPDGPYLSAEDFNGITFDLT